MKESVIRFKAIIAALSNNELALSQLGSLLDVVRHWSVTHFEAGKISNIEVDNDISAQVMRIRVDAADDGLAKAFRKINNFILTLDEVEFESGLCTFALGSVPALRTWAHEIHNAIVKDGLAAFPADESIEVLAA